ncbi:hypothetical protein ACF07S_28095 [Streptomyces sp. NPDC016640]|uniref:hypothetical protein n=1 Tax=Streptomyces sp. NPDC016640 TaxID=3364969 RepID=UPI0036F8BD85
MGVATAPSGPASDSDLIGPGRAHWLREARKRIRLLEQETEVLQRAAAYPSQANLPAE